MSGFFKFVLYLGVLAGLAGFALPRMADNPTVASANLPPEAPRYLSFGGLGLIVVGLVGRMVTRREPEAEWK